MTWLEFIASIIDSVSWPLFGFFIIIFFREKLLEWISASGPLSSFKAGPFEAKFAEYLDAAEDQISDSEEGLKIEDAGPSEKLMKYAQSDPKLAVLAAWADVEIKMRRILEENDSNLGDKLNTSPLPLSFISLTGLPDNVQKALGDLRRARNRIAHGMEINLSENDVTRYLDLIADVDSYLKNFESSDKPQQA